MQGTYGPFTCSQDNVLIETDGKCTFTGDITFTGVVTMETGPNCSFTEDCIVYLNNASCSLLLGNGSTAFSVQGSGQYAVVDGGGKKTVINGTHSTAASSQASVNLTGVDAIVRNLTGQNTSGAANGNDVVAVGGARQLVHAVNVVNSDDDGISIGGVANVLAVMNHIQDADLRGIQTNSGSSVAILAMNNISSGNDNIQVNGDQYIIVNNIGQNNEIYIGGGSNGSIGAANRVNSGVRSDGTDIINSNNDETSFT